LLDEDSHAMKVGRDLFGVEEMTARTALRDLIRSGDNWLVACAVATAAELNLTDLRKDIEPLADHAGTDVGPVARKALTVLVG